MKVALSNSERHEQMQQAIHRFPFITKNEHFSPNWLSIICYGPSLLDTWRTVRELDHSKMTVSGAHDFMVDRNIIPTWHVEMDPRAHKPKMLRNPRESTAYLMASVCHPDFWDTLKNYDVKLWHLINGNDTLEWVKEHHPEGLNSMIGGGSTVGQRAMNVAAALGFRKFKVFGMDCSFTVERHAGAHPNDNQPEVSVYFNGRTFRTTPYLHQAAKEMAQFLLTMDVEVEFYGDGLMQEIARMIKRQKGQL